MRLMRFTIGAAAIGALSLLPVTAAFASGPGNGSGNGSGNNGRSQTLITCGEDTFLVATSNGGQSNSAGQIVDQKGHGIPVSGTAQVVDVTADPNIVLFSSPIGHGNGHQNQTTTECTANEDVGTVAENFGPGPYPPGVSGSDEVAFEIDVAVILQP